MSKDSKIVRVKAERVGANFGHVGVLSLRNGRRLETTDVYPQAHQARDAAVSLAERRGYRVATASR